MSLFKSVSVIGYLYYNENGKSKKLPAEGVAVTLKMFCPGDETVPSNVWPKDLSPFDEESGSWFSAANLN